MLFGDFMNKNIIIAVLIIIIVAVIGAFVFSQPQTTTDGKLNTQIKILTDSKLKNGDPLEFELKDLQGMQFQIKQ